MNKATGIFLSETAAGERVKLGALAVSEEKLFEEKEFMHDYLTQRVVDVVKTESGEIKVAVLHINNFTTNSVILCKFNPCSSLNLLKGRDAQ